MREALLTLLDPSPLNWTKIYLVDEKVLLCFDLAFVDSLAHQSKVLLDCVQSLGIATISLVE